MTVDDPLIDTGIGRVHVSEARRYFRDELERTPTTENPRDSLVLLGMLRVFPDMLKKHSALEVINDFMLHPHLFDFETARALVREARIIAYAPYGEEASEYICFGDLSRNEMRQQCQYGSRYVHGRIDGYPNLAEGLRVEGNPFDCHSLRMHVDDVPIFMERYREHGEARRRA
jgi:hypothetical protein